MESNNQEEEHTRLQHTLDIIRLGLLYSAGGLVATLPRDCIWFATHDACRAEASEELAVALEAVPAMFTASGGHLEARKSGAHLLAL